MRPPTYLGVAVLLAFAQPLSAQSADTTHAASSSSRHAPALFTRRDLIYGGAFLAGTAVLLPLDRSIATGAQRPGLQDDRVLRHLAADVRIAAIPGTLIAAPALFLAGKIGHSERVADLGLHTTEAIVLAEGIGFVIKSAAGRARPFVVSDTLPYDFHPGRGLRHDNYASFPSGHALAGFATAAAVTAETARWWPHSTRYIAPLTYVGATLVGLSRLYNDQHWASDVMLAAGIGMFSGIKVVRYNHVSHPHNVIDRWLLSTNVVPVRGGAVVAWTMETR